MRPGKYQSDAGLIIGYFEMSGAAITRIHGTGWFVTRTALGTYVFSFPPGYRLVNVSPTHNAAAVNSTAIFPDGVTVEVRNSNSASTQDCALSFIAAKIT